MRSCERVLWVLACVGLSGGCRPSLRRMEVADPQAYWPEGGFAELVPPIRLPTSLDATDHITIWLRIPENGRIGVGGASEHPTLIYPRGTVADRIEMREPAGAATRHDWAVMDVRGTTIGQDGTQVFHCLQPTGAGGALAGFEWRRGDERAEHAAADGLVAIAIGGRLAGAPEHVRAAFGERLRKLNRCAACHEPERAARTRAAERGPRRATDGAGFYGVLDALADAAPLEGHRPRELNGQDPFISVSCGSVVAPKRDADGGFACPDGGLPVARFDLARARAESHPHALAVCRSRRYLFDHMDGAARAAFEAAFTECGIPP